MKSPTLTDEILQTDRSLPKNHSRESLRGTKHRRAIEARWPQPLQWEDSHMIRLLPSKWRPMVNAKRGINPPPGTDLPCQPKWYERPKSTQSEGHLMHNIRKPTRTTAPGKRGARETIDGRGNPVMERTEAGLSGA